MRGTIVMLLLTIVLITSGCVNQGEDNLVAKPESSATAYSGNLEKIEVFHFHGNSQCQSCINVGKCAEDTVNEFFQYEQKEGLLVFDHVNAELPENVELVKKYGVTGSSLWIGVYGKDGSFSKEQNINVWYKTNDMEKCREYVKGVIEDKLRGE